MIIDGILRGLTVTLKHFFETYLVDIKQGKKRYQSVEGIKDRSSSKAAGLFTIQYPEERAIIPEEFRFIPFLLYSLDEQGNRDYRCTACGICAKVCPPQCIWITRESDPATGRPVAKAREFNIDIDICMNCGLCAEYCPFDSIKMDHDFEISSLSRQNHIRNKEQLGKSVEYYAKIRPGNYAAEEAKKAAKAQPAAQA